MASKGSNALKGAATGAAAGAALGPWGAAAGGVIGGVAGYFGTEDEKGPPQYNPDKANFKYGLGPSDSYASMQSAKYDQQQANLQALAGDAYNREAPQQALPDRIDQVQSQGQGYLQGADAQGRAAQLAALGGLQNQTGALNRFAAAPMGPSAAQAQLQAGTDAAARQQYGFARSQAGGGGAALRSAAFNAAGISGNAANQAAALRAQETQAFRGQQLQALGAAQQGAGMSAGYAGQLRTGDQGFAQAQAGQANYDAGAANQFNQGQQQMQYQVGSNNLQAQLTNQGQGDATALGALGMAQGYEGYRNQNAAAQAQAGYNYESAKAQAAGLGTQQYNSGVQQGNLERQETYGALAAGAGAVGTLTGGQGGGQTAKPPVTSDVRAKENIRPTSVLAALGGNPGRALYEQQTGPGHVRDELADVGDIRARGGFDRNVSEFGNGPAPDPLRARLHAIAQANGGQLPSTWGTGDEPAPDMRPAQGYEYDYRNPQENGAGKFVGPMAQDLEHLPGVVEQKPNGEKAINAPRLTLANTAAVSELQQRQDALDRSLKLRALGAYSPAYAPGGSFVPGGR